ncbi:hypothetical protein PTTW11_07322 [Pyrenophora teres f. teres]|uniref:Uncharacterized protein n=1 Tax=Pyrenophora teres f. teres TaxID=97479 RepID=A0A6S6W689_9PLEO|nr:hypothetical protein PTTW11_07322 [Pyrenophora teres f. teres]
MHFKYLFAVLATMMTTTSALNICFNSDDCQSFSVANCGGIDKAHCTAQDGGACKCNPT